eukprot:1157397-Pelagomonas_calceolata.AAC.9
MVGLVDHNVIIPHHVIIPELWAVDQNVSIPLYVIILELWVGGSLCGHPMSSSDVIIPHFVILPELRGAGGWTRFFGVLSRGCLSGNYLGTIWELTFLSQPTPSSDGVRWVRWGPCQMECRAEAALVRWALRDYLSSLLFSMSRLL